MPYRIRSHGSPASEIRRLAEEQIDRAIAEIDDASLDRHETVHQVRKRCKKVRGVLRLLRGPLDEDDTYARENARFRDAAGRLSRVRDAEALIETYDALMDHFRGQVERRAFGTIRRRLTLRRRRIADEEIDLDERLAEFRRTLVAGRKQVAAWARRAEDGIDALLPGLSKTYRRGRRAMDEAFDDPSPEQFHEWRKRTKYHGYHCRLLRDTWRPLMEARVGELDRLSDLLGDEHDLNVFETTLTADPSAFGDRKSLGALLGLLERRRTELRRQARPLGVRLFAEKPKHLERRIRACWLARRG